MQKLKLLYIIGLAIVSGFLIFESNDQIKVLGMFFGVCLMMPLGYALKNEMDEKESTENA